MHITIPAAAARLLARLNDHGYEAYVVGGCVRDALMGRTPHDWDICTDALPQQVKKVFAGHPIHDTGIRHGTVLVMEQGEGYEITTFRVDGDYSDHRHPDRVSFVRSLREDLARRDFTVNAMAYHPSAGLIDLFGGEADLAAGVIRCVGEPSERFAEDGLRILRALRFAARFCFQVEERTGQAMHAQRALLDYIAAERIFSELKGFLSGGGVCALLLEYRDVFAQFLPEVAGMFDFHQYNPHHCYDVWTHTAHAVECAPPETVLRLTMLFHDIGKPSCFTRDERGIGHFLGHPEVSAQLADDILRRLRSDNRLREAVVRQVRSHDWPLPETERAGRRFLARLGEEGARWSLAVHRADILAQHPATQPAKLERLARAEALLDALLAQQACFQLKDLAVNGRDLIDLGLAPGPSVGQELKRLFALVIEGECPNERGALLARVQRPKEHAETT